MTQEFKIDELIERNNDPVIRGVLLVLQKLDASLDSNTAATQRIAVANEHVDARVKEISATLVKHVNDEDKMLAFLRGGQIVAAVMMSAILFLGGYIIKTQFDKTEKQDILLVEQAKDQRELRAVQLEVLRRLSVLEKK